MFGRGGNKRVKNQREDQQRRIQAHQEGRVVTKKPPVRTMDIITTLARVCAVLGTMVITPSSKPRPCTRHTGRGGGAGTNRVNFS
jgi:hypothetical protein